jgi:hypothetical protein
MIKMTVLIEGTIEQVREQLAEAQMTLGVRAHTFTAAQQGLSYPSQPMRLGYSGHPSNPVFTSQAGFLQGTAYPSRGSAHPTQPWQEAPRPAAWGGGSMQTVPPSYSNRYVPGENTAWQDTLLPESSYKRRMAAHRIELRDRALQAYQMGLSKGMHWTWFDSASDEEILQLNSMWQAALDQDKNPKGFSKIMLKFIESHPFHGYPEEGREYPSQSPTNSSHFSMRNILTGNSWQKVQRSRFVSYGLDADELGLVVDTNA